MKNRKYLVGAMLACAISGLVLTNKASAALDWAFRAPSVSDASAVDPKTEGDILYDTSSSSFKGWNGTSWTDFGSTSQPNLAIRSVTSTDTSTSNDDVLILSSSSFNETLFTASGNQGKVITLKHSGTSLSQVYTLLTGGETVGGLASGAYKLYTNGEILKLVSDGTNWLVLEHKTDTDWTAFPYLTAGGTAASPGNNLISAVTTAPSFGSGNTLKAYWRRVGRNFEFMIDYVQTSAGSNGSGMYVINLPITMDTNLVTANTSATTSNVAISSQVGTFYDGLSATLGIGAVIPYSSTQVKALAQTASTSSATDAITWQSSQHGFANAAFSWGIRASVPVDSWQP